MTNVEDKYYEGEMTGVRAGRQSSDEALFHSRSVFANNFLCTAQLDADWSSNLADDIPGTYFEILTDGIVNEPCKDWVVDQSDQIHVTIARGQECYLILASFEVRSVDVDKYTKAESGTGNLRGPNNKHSSPARSWKFISSILWPWSTPPTPETHGTLSTKDIEVMEHCAKPFPGLENLPRSFWHELSSPFTEVYEVESFATEAGGTPEPRPFFEDPESNITVQLGAHVYMHCRVQNLQDTLKLHPGSLNSLQLPLIIYIVSQVTQAKLNSKVVPKVHPCSRSQKPIVATKFKDRSKIQLQNHLDIRQTLRDSKIIWWTFESTVGSLDRSSTAPFESFVFMEGFEDCPNVRVPSFVEG
ncbi:hypothetical protein WN51_10295 [Melipona quadrifasciata]|uniref:Uncharacterized protein n=2 Tax=Meliponini TaxID=83319 RepID=A0A0M9A4R2_9HYME|nr:hypothetical protein WN51_10295 [Melipona quadrifasciata]